MMIEDVSTTSQVINDSAIELPAHSRTKSRLFTALLLPVLAINIACGIVIYSIYSAGEILSDLYTYLASRDLNFFIWVAAGAGLLGTALTLVAYIMSFDYRRPARPVVRLWILLGSYAVFLAGLLLGMANVDADNVPVILGSALLCVIVPLAVIFLEKALGGAALKSARKFLESNSPSSARASARTALTLCPGRQDCLKTYGLALSASGRHKTALPYLVYAENHEDPLEPKTAAALADAWEHAGNHAQAIHYLEQLPPEYDQPGLLDRKIRLWLESGARDKARHAIAALDTDARTPWRDQYRTLLIEVADVSGLETLCAEIRNDDESPYDRTVECLKEILSIDQSNTAALLTLIGIQKELREAGTVAALQEELLTINKQLHDVRRELIAYYSSYDNRLEVLRHLNRLVIADVATLDEKLLFLEETYRQGDYLRIEQLVLDDQELSTNAGALAILANALFEGGRNEEALDCISRAKRVGGANDKILKSLDSVASKIRKLTLDTELVSLQEKAAQSPADLDLKFDYLDRLVAIRSADRVVVELDDMLARQPDLVERVEKEIRVMLSRHGKNRRLMDFLGDLYLRHGNYDAAYEVYEQRATGEIDAAEILHDATQKILARRPDHVPSLLSEIRYHHDRQDPATTLEYYDRFLATGSSADADATRIEMEAAEKSGNLDRALTAGLQLVDSDNENAELLSRVAAIALEKEDFPRAIALLQDATRIDPDSFDYRRQLRRAVETMKRTRMEIIRNELKNQPGNRDLYEELGDLHHDFEEFNEAIAAYQRAGINDPSRRVPKAKQGYVLARKGLFVDADEVLKEADLRPDLKDDEQEKLKNLFYITAELMEEEEERERALELYRRILRVDAGYREVVGNIERLQVSDRKKQRRF